MPSTFSFEEIAEIAHEANRAYRKQIGESIGERWDESPDWKRQSTIAGVEAISEDRNLRPKESHEAWYARKVSEGWKYGEVENRIEKLHPCCLPYDQLPEAQRVKDRLFGAICRVLLFEEW